MNFIFNWIKLIDKVTLRYRRWSQTAILGTPYALDEAFKKNYNIISADDKQIVYDISLHFIEVMLYFCVAVTGILFLSLFFSFLVHNIYVIMDFNLFSAFDEEPRIQPFSVKIFLSVVFGVFFFFIFPASIVGVLYPALRPKHRYVVFDRENQTVTIPQRFWGKDSVTVPYNEFLICQQQDYGAYMGQIRLFALRPNDGQVVRIGKNDPVRERALFHRYMRSDLELPDGELLDPYRERDSRRINMRMLNENQAMYMV